MKNSFSQERLTFRLDMLAQEAIRTNDGIFKAQLGLRIHEVRVLRIIGHNPGIIFVDLVREANLERSQTSRILQGLIKRGLIRRENDAVDARRFQLFTTDEGEAKRTEARRLSDSLEVSLLEPLKAAEVDHLNDLLSRLAEWIRSDEYHDQLDAFGLRG